MSRKRRRTPYSEPRQWRTAFVGGRQTRIMRRDESEFLERILGVNADPVSLHQHELWWLIAGADDEPRAEPDPEPDVIAAIFGSEP